jgi:hypothetical protein
MSKTMPTILTLVTVALGTLPAAATEEKVDPTKMTCEAFVTLADEEQPRIMAWLDGYSRSGKPATAVPVAVKKQVEVIKAACLETPKQSLWQKIRAKLPGGSKQTVPDPAKMTCEEFVQLDKEVQPEVAYWLDGYNQGAEQGGMKTAGTKAEGGVGAPLVALDRDVVLMVNECREAPKQSLWEKIKSKF